MLSILRLGLALLLGMAAASSAGAGAGAAATTPADAAIVTAHPALRGTLGRRLPHPVVAVTTNEVSEVQPVHQPIGPSCRTLTRGPQKPVADGPFQHAGPHCHRGH